MSSRTIQRSTMIALVTGIMMLAQLPAAIAAAPDNDSFAEAETIDALPYADVLDATDATREELDRKECGGSYGGTVWYRYTSPNSMRLTANTFGSDYDTVINVITDLAQASPVACNDNWKGSQSRVSFDADAGTTYYFQVSGSGGELAFSLAVAVPPPNDDIRDAKRIPIKLPWTLSMETAEATLDVNDPTCSGKSRSVWFRYKRPNKWSARQIELATFRSDYDTTLSVYTGRPGNLEQIRCNDNSGGSQSKLRFKAEPGKTYYVMVGSARNSSGGQLRLKAKQPPIPFRMDMGLDPTGSSSSVTGTAVVGGTFDCSRKAKVSLTVSIRQRVGDHVTSGYERKSMTCNGKRSWRVTVSANRPFETGSAGVWATLSAPKENKQRKQQRVVTLSACSQCI